MPYKNKAEQKEAVREAQRRFQMKQKEEAIAHYGPCSCGESRIECLTIVRKEKENVKKKRERTQVYSFLKKNGYPKGFETKCKNCIAVKGGARK